MNRWLTMIVLISWSTLHAQVTYHKDIAPIISAHCQSCHSPGDIGPMALTTYDEVSSYASMINFVINSKLMPPFKADLHNVKYKNARSVSEEEKAKIAAWIEDGLKEGVKPIPASQSMQDQDETYDYTICMEEAFEHYGIYYDQYQAFTLPLDFKNGKYIKSIHFSPGNKEIVRSAKVSIAPEGASQSMDEWDPRYGFFAYGNLGFTSSFPVWYSWMPHTESTNLATDERLYIPKDSELLMHLHYGPFGETQMDSSCIHFDFAEAPDAIMQNVPLIKSDFLKDTFLIEKGKKTRISSSFTIPVDVRLKSVTPQAHLLCRSWEVFAVLPDRSSIPLLSIEDWDFHWKEQYVFLDEIKLPAGSEIHAIANYDNTVSNPYNPASPPHTMRKGPHMYDENFECFFEFIPPESDGGHIIKPFLCKEDAVEEISFQITLSDSIKIRLYNLDTQQQVDLAAKWYESGMHIIRSADLPNKSGRYCVSLESSKGVIDNWWIVIL